MEYILALLLTSSVIFISYRVGKRAGINEERLRINEERQREQENIYGIISTNNTMPATELDTWLQERKSDKPEPHLPTEF